MSTPSAYEMNAWDELEASRDAGFAAATLRQVNDFASSVNAHMTSAADKALDQRPRLRRALSNGQEKMASSARTVAGGVRSAAGHLGGIVPESATDWASTAARAAGDTSGKAGRLGLTPSRVVHQHQKRGANIESLHEVRQLDLADIDAVRGRTAGLIYSATAMASGAGTGIVATGGTLGSMFSAGAAALPSAGAAAGTMAADMAFVFSVYHRATARAALVYGYDPEVPAEQLFMLGIMNLTSASTAAAKQAAMKDLAKLTHALAVKMPWAQIEQSLMAKLLKSFMGRFTNEVTKNSLGKAVPVAGIAVGALLNGFTVDQVVRDADLAYRRRFLLEKYPELENRDGDETDVPDTSVDSGDVYSVIADLERIHREGED